MDPVTRLIFQIGVPLIVSAVVPAVIVALAFRTWERRRQPLDTGVGALRWLAFGVIGAAAGTVLALAFEFRRLGLGEVELDPWRLAGFAFTGSLLGAVFACLAASVVETQ